jgi:hypothetical protein
VPPFPHFFGFAPVSIWVWLFMFAGDTLSVLVLRHAMDKYKKMFFID